MVKENVKTNNCFILWNYQIDFTKRGDTSFYDPEKQNTSKYSNNNVFDFADYIKGFAFKSTDYLPNGEIGIFRVSDIDDVIDFNGLAMVDNGFWDKYSNFRIKPLDIVITVTGNTVGKCFLMPRVIPKILMNQNAMILRTKNELNVYFLYAFLKTNLFKEKIEIMAHAGTRPFLDLNFFRNITLPELKSSEKEKVKEIIEIYWSLLEKSKDNYQKTVDIFNKELNKYLDISKKEKSFVKWNNEINILDRIDPFFYFENEYEKNPNEFILLGDVADVLIGKTPAFDDYVESGNRIMKFRAIRGNGIDWENEERGFVKEEISNKYKNSLEQDNIVLGCAAHQASYIGSKIDIVDYIPDEFKKVFTVAEIITIKAKTDINPYVLLLFMRSQVGYELIQRQVKGQTSHLYPKDVKKIKIPKDLLKLSKSDKSKEIEKLIKLSLKEKRESKEKLEEAKQFVEGLIEKSK